MVKFSHSKLRGRIREVCGNETAFCELMPFNRGTLSLKLNGSTEFLPSEIMIAVKALGLTMEDIPSYFFCIDGSENRQ